jgi:hypothetical protein
MLKSSKTKKFKEEKYSSYFQRCWTCHGNMVFHTNVKYFYCMFEETKSCQVLNTYVLETKKCWMFSLCFEKPGMFQVYFMFIWGNTKCQVLYACIQEPLDLLSIFHVCFEKTQNVQYFMHIQETTNVEYFIGMPITSYKFKKTKNVEYFTLVFKKPWTLSILCECKVTHAYLRNENSKYLNAYLRKQKMSNTLSILKKPQ